MNCEEVRHNLELYLLQELPPDQAEAIEGHLASCAACQAERDAAAELLSTLDDTLGRQATPDGLSTRIMVRVERRRKTVRLRRVAALAAAACLVVGLSVRLVLWPERKGERKGDEVIRLVGCYVTATTPDASFEVTGPRRIRLDRGELLLDVRPHSEKLTVDTPAGAATALGTRFYVRTEETGRETMKKHFVTTVVVLSGIVQLANVQGIEQAVAGEVAVAEQGVAPVKQKAHPPWKRELIVKMQQQAAFDFVATPFPDVVEFLNQAFGLPVVLHEDLARKKVTLTVKDLRLRTALDLMCLTTNAEWALKDETVFVRRPGSARREIRMRTYSVESLLQMTEADRKDVREAIENDADGLKLLAQMEALQRQYDALMRKGKEAKELKLKEVWGQLKGLKRNLVERTEALGQNPLVLAGRQSIEELVENDPTARKFREKIAELQVQSALMQEARGVPAEHVEAELEIKPQIMQLHRTFAKRRSQLARTAQAKNRKLEVGLLLAMVDGLARKEEKNSSSTYLANRLVDSCTLEADRAIRAALDALGRVRPGMNEVCRVNTSDFGPSAFDCSADAPAHIAEKLQKAVSFEFAETPFKEVIDFLTQTTGLTILLDPRDDHLYHSEITLKADNMTLRSALDWICRKALVADYFFVGDAILVTTRERAAQWKNSRMVTYGIGDVCSEQGDAENLVRAIDQLRKALIRSGGVWPAPKGKMLIRGSAELHQQVSEFLDTLRQTAPGRNR